MENFIDWVSRKGEDNEAKLAFKDKLRSPVLQRA